MRWTRGQKGVTLVELMITLVIFSVVISMIYSVYNAFLKQATSERKTVKTEMDVINVVWPLIKEIQTAGMGVPSWNCSSLYQCSCGIATTGGNLIIHSAAAGDSQHAGKWSYIAGSSCNVTDMYASIGGNALVIIDNTTKNKLGSSTVDSSNVIASCNSSYATNVAYWYRTDTGDNIECYETIYSLQTYDSGTRPATCEVNTRRLARSSRAKSNDADFATMLDCVFGSDGTDTGFNYRFGCISSSGNLTWQTGTDCGTKKLRLVKIGVVVQSSTRRDTLSQTPITLFEGLRDSTGASLEIDIDLTADQRYYKWRKLEQTIALKNLE